MSHLLDSYIVTAEKLTANNIPNAPLWWAHFRSELYDCFQKKFLTPDDLVEVEEHTPEGPLTFTSVHSLS